MPCRGGFERDSGGRHVNYFRPRLSEVAPLEEKRDTYQADESRQLDKRPNYRGKRRP